MSTVISRDPFTRHDVVRRVVKTDRTCEWCGNRKASGTLFEYGINRDDRNRDEWEGRLFCSKSCRNSFQGGN